MLTFNSCLYLLTRSVNNTEYNKYNCSRFTVKCHSYLGELYLILNNIKTSDIWAGPHNGQQIACAPSEDSDQIHTIQSKLCRRSIELLDVWLPVKRKAMTLISLCICTGWSSHCLADMRSYKKWCAPAHLPSCTVPLHISNGKQQ